MLITSPVGYVVKCSLWKPNILAFFNLGSWLRHSVAAAGTEFKEGTGGE